MSAEIFIIPLGELCDVLDRKRKPITKKDRILGPYPYYGATGILDYVEGYLFDEPLVLIGEDGAKWGSGERTAFIADGKYWVNNHAHVIRPHRDVVLDSWIIYYLNTTDLSPFITGLTVPKLNQGKLREIPIPVPSLEEQKRIVAILDEAFAGIDAAIANTQQNLANARELFESYLNSVCAKRGARWEKRSLSEVVISQPRNGWSPPAKNHSDSGTPVLSLSSVTGFNFNLSKRKYTSAETKHDAHYWIKNGDLLITRSNTPELVGHVAIVDNINQPTIYPDLIMKIKINQDIVLTRFVYYQLRSDKMRELISGSANGANPTMKKINKGIVQGLPVMFPNIEEQEKIVQSLDYLLEQSKSLETIYQQKLNALNELKQSLLQKAFSGELTAADEIAQAQAVA